MEAPRVKVCAKSSKGTRVVARFSLTNYEMEVLSLEAYNEGYDSLPDLISDMIAYLIDGSMPKPTKTPRAADLQDR